MDDSNSVPPESVSPARTRRLKSLKPDGNVYKRWADVEAEILRVLALHELQWLAELPDLQNETLVFLIRHVRYGNQELYGRLLQELCRRVLGQSTRSIYGLDETTRDYIASQVEHDIVKLVLIESPTRRSDYLEIAFAKAVHLRTLDYVRRHRRSPMGHRAEVAPNTTEHDTEEIEDPLDLVADHRPGPQASLLQREGDAQQAKTLKKMKKALYRAVKDPLDRKLIQLHIAKGLQIESSDPNTDTVERRVGRSAQFIKSRISRAMKALRKALGV